MRQHFELGQFLRKRYKGFLNESYNRHEVGDASLMMAEEKEAFKLVLEFQEFDGASP